MHLCEPADTNVTGSVCLCAWVRAPPGANTVKAGGNQIGRDLCWQVLRTIVITPV